MKILVIGAGLLGSHILNTALKRGMVCIGTAYNDWPEIPGCEIFQLDKSDRERVKSFITKHHPDITIDTAAIHNVDECEEFPEKSAKVNVEGTCNVAQACKHHNSKMVFISSDYVFDGQKGDYKEEDEPRPLSVYGKHKLEAEKIVLDINPNSIICRPSVIYGWGGPTKNFVTWLLTELKAGHEVKIVSDQCGNPTFAGDLAEIILDLCEKNVNGVFHTTGSECINRYEFAKTIADIFDLNADLIKPIKTEELVQKALRPKKCCMNVDKTSKTIGHRPLDCRQGLSKMAEVSQ